MGLIAPQSEMVNLTMNGDWRGVHVLVEQLDESTLRRHRLMPGDLYRGELVSRDRYVGVSNHVFEHPGLWDKAAINNHNPPESMAPLQDLLGLVMAGSSEATQAEASRLMDMQAWGTFSAYETLIQTIHYGISHNWRIYYDAARERLVPVVWDPDAWHPNWMPAAGDAPQYDFLPSELHRFLHQNGDFLRAKQRALHSFFSTGLDQKFLAEARALAKRMEVAIRVDPFVQAQPSGRPIGASARIAGMAKLIEDIQRVFAEVRREYIGNPASVHYATNRGENTYRIQVEGRGAIERLELRFAEAPSGLDPNPMLSFWIDGERNDVEATSAVSASDRTLTIWPDLIPEHKIVTEGSHMTKKYRIALAPGYFELSIGGDIPAYEIFVDSGDGILRPATQVADLEEGSFRGIYRPASKQFNAKPEFWSNTVTINGLRELDRDITILPGTRVLLGPGASIVFRGKLTVAGTPEQPVSFLPANAEEGPWGSIVLHGSGADSSTFSNCLFKGGSGYKTSVREYSGMLSIHSVSDVVIDACAFQDNFVVDDMLHAVYSDVEIKDSTFEGAVSDAVDLDISTGVISRSVFEENGNDGIDLMTTDAVIVDCEFVKNLDKGVSAGEGSRLLLVDSQFRENEIGVQFKDGTAALLGNISFVGNKISADAYKKNWRYGSGGSATIAFSKVAGSPTIISADDKSSITLIDNVFDTAVDLMGDVVFEQSPAAKRSVDFGPTLIRREPFAKFRDDHKQYWDRSQSKAAGLPAASG